MANEFPAIETLIPHRGTMLLLDRVVDFRHEMAIAEYAPRPDAWYADAAGDMPAWMGIELMAQTVAVLVALTKQRQGLPAKMGVLLGSRRYHASASSFAGGRTLRIRAETRLLDASGMGAYDCAIEGGGEILASSTLKVYEPDNFELFAQGNH